MPFSFASCRQAIRAPNRSGSASQEAFLAIGYPILRKGPVLAETR
jgi:hypothetical protein